MYSRLAAGFSSALRFRRSLIAIAAIAALVVMLSAGALAQETAPAAEHSAGGEASLYVALGDHKKALDFLDRAFQERSYGVLFLHLYPEFKPLRSEPRFQALLKAVGIQKS